MTKREGRSEILRGKIENFSAPGPALALNGLGGQRTETKFTKWSVSLKRLRTTALLNTPYRKVPDEQFGDLAKVMEIKDTRKGVPLKTGNPQNLYVLSSVEDSASTETAWKGAGQKEGLKIWRIVVSLSFVLFLCFLYFPFLMCFIKAVL